MKRAVMVGNHTFPLDASTGAQIVDVIRGLGNDVTLLTRKRGPVDVFIQHCAIILGVRCLTYDAEGGSSNIERDSALIRDATELHAFLCLDDFEQGRESGTEWLVQKGLSAGLPVYAYASIDGALVHVGSPAEEGA